MAARVIGFTGPEGQNSGSITSGTSTPGGGQTVSPGQGGSQPVMPGPGTVGNGSSNTPGTPNTSTNTSIPNASVEKPVVSSEGAVLLNANTGEVLFEKNGTTRFYPASITKLMTALLTVENCRLSDTVTFSKSATTNLESGAVTLSLVEGDKLTVEQCLYALLLESANEVANGLAEHISGSVSAFADKMNARARELGCTDTHFVNPNGLNNEQHYTTPRDMALIARAAFQNPTIVKAASTLFIRFRLRKRLRPERFPWDIRCCIQRIPDITRES